MEWRHHLQEVAVLAAVRKAHPAPPTTSCGGASRADASPIPNCKKETFGMCSVDGCHRPPTKFSYLCESHRNVERVHGDPRQKGITKSDLRPYIKAVQGYLARRSGPRAEAVIERDWQRAVGSAEVVLEDNRRGRAQPVYERRAAEIIIDINRERHAMDVATLMMALGYFYADQPRRWASDRGFQFQAVRMFRRLAKSQTDYRWRPDGGMVRSSARRCPPRVTLALWASIFATGFVGYGIQIRNEIEKERELKRKDSIADLREILGPLSTVAKGQPA